MKRSGRAKFLKKNRYRIRETGYYVREQRTRKLKKEARLKYVYNKYNVCYVTVCNYVPFSYKNVSYVFSTTTKSENLTKISVNPLKSSVILTNMLMKIVRRTVRKRNLENINC